MVSTARSLVIEVKAARLFLKMRVSFARRERQWLRAR